MAELCGARTVFWPDDECMDVGPCILPEGHRGDHREADLTINLNGRMSTFEGNTWGKD